MILVVFLLSMTGIPPLAGFIGKFGIFAAVIKSPSLLWLGVVAVINSVISLYYYFRMVHQAFFVQSDAAGKLSYSPALISCLVFTLGMTVIFGLLPDPIINLVRHVMGS